MSKRLSSKDFIALYDALWEEGPTVKYNNPDMWLSHLSRKYEKT